MLTKDSKLANSSSYELYLHGRLFNKFIIKEAANHKKADDESKSVAARQQGLEKPPPRENEHI